MGRFVLEYRKFALPPSTVNPFIVCPESEASDGSDMIGINNLQFSARHNSYKHYDVSATNTIVVRGALYSFIKLIFFSGAGTIADSIEVRILDTVYNKYLFGYFYIKPQGIKDCRDNCTYEVRLTHENLTLKKINDTLVDTTLQSNPDAAHDWFDQNSPLLEPIFNYCKPNGFSYIVAIILYAVMGALIVFVGFIISLIDDFDLLENARGCDRKLPTRYVRTFLRNLADNCGISVIDDHIYHDPIFIAELYYACVFYQPEGDGIARDNNGLFWAYGKNLSWSGERFLSSFVNGRHNGKWRLAPNTLKIRYQYEPYLAAPLFDFSDDDTLCCTWNGEKYPAYGDYKHGRDSIETYSNDCLNFYNDIVEFNNPASPNQSGAIVREFEIAPQGFRNDGMRKDTLTDIENAFSFLFSIISWLTGLTNADRFALVSSHVTELPRLVIYDPNSDVLNAKAINRPFTPAERAVAAIHGYPLSQTGDSIIRFYNSPLPTNNDLLTIGTQNTYVGFVQDNPRLNKCKQNKTCEVTVAICNELQLILNGLYENSEHGIPIDYPVRLEQGVIGEIRQIDFNFEANTITYKIQPIGCESDYFNQTPCTATVQIQLGDVTVTCCLTIEVTGFDYAGADSRGIITYYDKVLTCNNIEVSRESKQSINNTQYAVSCSTISTNHITNGGYLIDIIFSNPAITINLSSIIWNDVADPTGSVFQTDVEIAINAYLVSNGVLGNVQCVAQLATTGQLIVNIVVPIYHLPDIDKPCMSSFSGICGTYFDGFVIKNIVRGIWGLGKIAPLGEFEVLPCGNVTVFGFANMDNQTGTIALNDPCGIGFALPTPNFTHLTPANVECLPCLYREATAIITPLIPISSYNWVVDSGMTIISGQGTNQIIYLGYGTITVEAQAANCPNTFIGSQTDPPPAPATVTITSITSVCTGTNIGSITIQFNVTNQYAPADVSIGSQSIVLPIGVFSHTFTGVQAIGSTIIVGIVSGSASAFQNYLMSDCAGSCTCDLINVNETDATIGNCDGMINFELSGCTTPVSIKIERLYSGNGYLEIYPNLHPLATGCSFPPPLNLISPNQYELSQINAGSYLISVIDANSCINSTAKTVNEV
jgi:hypothetical protein